MEAIVLDTDVASLSFKRALPPALLPHLLGRRPFITFATLGELSKWADQRCLVYEMPLATLNIKDFINFTEHEGLEIVGRPSP